MIYMLGGAGSPNLGDEIIVKSWLDTIKRIRPAEPIIVDCGNPDVLTFLCHGLGLEKARFVNLFNAASGKQPSGLWPSLIAGYRFFERNGLKSLPHTAKLLSEIKVFHLHGGGYIMSHWPHSIFKLGIAAAFKKALGCKVVATGLGILPLPDVPPEHADLFKEILQQFDLFEVRDQGSFDYLMRNSPNARNVRLGLDDSYLSECAPAPPTREPALHVSCFRTKVEKWPALLGSVSRDFLSRFAKVYFWECSPKEDPPAFVAVSRSFPHCENVTFDDLILNGLPVELGDFMLTTRFHPHLLAARGGCGGRYLSDGNYYDPKHGSVVRLGSHFTPHDAAPNYDLWTPVALATSDIVTQNRKLMAQKRSLADEIYRRPQ